MRAATWLPPAVILTLAACGTGGRGATSTGTSSQSSTSAGTGGAAASASSAAASSSTATGTGGSGGGSCWKAPTYPLDPNPAGYDGLPAMGPMVIDGQSGVTISGLAIKNPSGDCVRITNSKNIILDHVAIGPCGGHGVSTDAASSAITVRRSLVHDTGGNDVDVYKTAGVRVEMNTLVRGQSGVYADSATGVVVERNTIIDVQGPVPRGQLVQLNNVTGPGNRVFCNSGQNVLGQSNPEDNINLFASNGDPASPIVVEGNRIMGGGPSTSGGGILLGDGAGSHQIARNNVAVDPGQYGMAVAGGTDMTLADNQIFAKQQAFTNIGIYVNNYYAPKACGMVTVQQNQVSYTNKTGMQNGYWSPGTCGTVSEAGNDFASKVGPSIIDTVPAVCMSCP